MIKRDDVKPLSSLSATGVITILPYSQKTSNTPLLSLSLAHTLIYNLLPSNHGLTESPVHDFFSFVVWAKGCEHYRKPLRMSHTSLASAIIRCVCVWRPFTNAAFIEDLKENSHQDTLNTVIQYSLHQFVMQSRGYFALKSWILVFCSGHSPSTCLVYFCFT